MYIKRCVLIGVVLLTACKDARTGPDSVVIKRAIEQENCGMCDSDVTRQLIMQNFKETTLTKLAQQPLELSSLKGDERTDPFYYFANDFRKDISRIGALKITNVSSVSSTHHHCTCAAKILFASDAFAESTGVVNYRYCVTEKPDGIAYYIPSVSLHDMYINDIPLVRMTINSQK